MSGELGQRPIVGFRVWRVIDGRLCSLMPFPTDRNSLDLLRDFKNIKWDDAGDTEAICLARIPHKDSVPKLLCSCGIHGFNLVWQALAKYTVLCKDCKAYDYVCGAIVLSGKVALHETGFRAERAHPIAFIDPRDINAVDSNDISHIKQAAHTHGIPIMHFREIEPYAEQFGDIL